MNKPTDEQSALINYQPEPSSLLKAVAYAGTGKTSTLEAFAVSHLHDDILYLGFNKATVTEAGKRFPLNCTLKTWHSLAYGAIGYRYKSIVGSLRSSDIAKALRFQLYKASVTRVALESWLNSAEEHPSAVHLPVDELGLLTPGWEDSVLAGIETLYTQMITKQLPMTHNCYLKAFHLSKPILSQDIILMDEAQDTNPVCLAILIDQIAHRKKIILVGDPYQQIYSWRGAINAMDKIDCETLRLTRSFRFGENICSIANKILSRLLNEQTPVVGTEQTNGLDKTTIICRTNAGMFGQAVSLCQKEQMFTVIGEARFQQLLTEVEDIYLLSAKRPDKIQTPYLKYFASFADLLERAKLTLDYELQMKAGIVEDYGTEIPHQISRIRKNISAQAATGIVTGHQSKGLEWDTVRLADDFPSLQAPDGKTKRIVDRADKNSETDLSREEANLLYVACTRAKRTLQPTQSINRFLNQ